MNEMTLPSWHRIVARYFSVTEALHNIEYSRVSGEEIFCFFDTWRSEWRLNPQSPSFISFINCAPGPHPGTVWYPQASYQPEIKRICHTPHQLLENKIDFFFFRNGEYLTNTWGNVNGNFATQKYHELTLSTVKILLNFGGTLTSWARKHSHLFPWNY